MCVTSSHTVENTRARISYVMSSLYRHGSRGRGVSAQVPTRGQHVALVENAKSTNARSLPSVL